MAKKSGPRFKQRRKFNREEVFPKKVAQEKMAEEQMAEEMALYQNMVISINRAFPDREERMEYIQTLIDGLAVEDDEDGDRSTAEVDEDSEEVGEGDSAAEVDGDSEEVGDGDAKGGGSSSGVSEVA